MGDSEKYAQYAHRKDLTFRQAEGKEPLPKMLAYGELNKHLRLELWDILYPYFSENIKSTNRTYSPRGFREGALIPAIFFGRDVLRMPIDEAKALAGNPKEFIQQFKQIIFAQDYSDCLEAVQFFLRFPRLSQRLKERLIETFDDPFSPYMVVDFPPLTIIPRGDENEQEAFKENWAIIKASTFEGAKSHLQKSAEALNAGDYTGAFREAIHSIESAVKVITSKPSADLAAGLRELGKAQSLHPALKDGFTKLYGYASDEKGVRHALIEAENGNVGRDEALYFFSACTAFVAYLARKFPEKM